MGAATSLGRLKACELQGVRRNVNQKWPHRDAPANRSRVAADPAAPAQTKVRRDPEFRWRSVNVRATSIKRRAGGLRPRHGMDGEHVESEEKTDRDVRLPPGAHKHAHTRGGEPAHHRGSMSAALANSAKVAVWRKRYGFPGGVDHDFVRGEHVDVLHVPCGHVSGVHVLGKLTPIALDKRERGN